MKKKFISGTYQAFICLFMIAMLAACENPPKPTTSLQIFGLDTEVFVSSALGSPSEQQTHYFLYYYLPKGNQTYFRISRVSKSDYDANNINNPIEANVGQFGIWAISHTLYFPNTITNADFKLRMISRCAAPAVVDNTTSIGNCNAPAQVASLNCTAMLKLSELLNQQHTALQSQNPTCRSMQDWGQRGMINIESLGISHEFTLTTNITSTPQYSDFPSVKFQLKPIYHPGIQ